MTRRQPDAGFTLTELLVVLVIMPLVFGAIAAAIIISEQDSGLASGRLADSANAQITSEYYQRDVQGAQCVTTTANIQTPCAIQSPPVCVNPALPTPTLILGIYRAVTPTAPGLSVAYWTTPGPSATLVRDSCSVGNSGTISFSDQVLISDDISSSRVSATISPGIFETDSSSGWTPISATTKVQPGQTLPGSGTFSLSVVSTSGFQTGLLMTVRSTAGSEKITCTGRTPLGQPPAFTGCTATPGSAVLPSQAVLSQEQGITSISISVTEPNSGYTYSLQASPRTSASRTTGVPSNGAGTGAALVSLSDVALSGDATLTVQGAVDINGSLKVSGLTGGGGLTSTHLNVGPAPDPLGPFLPTTVTTTGGPYGSPGTPCIYNPNPPPGEYQCQLDVQPGADVQLSAGVYQLDGGITVDNGATLSASGGTLLYLPCTGPCNESAIFDSGATVTIPPLTPAGALAASGNTGTGLQGVWFWQASRGTGTTLVGNGQTGNTSGIAYAPNAPIDLSNSSAGDYTGEIVAGSVTMEPSTGSASLVVTGQ